MRKHVLVLGLTACCSVIHPAIRQEAAGPEIRDRVFTRLSEIEDDLIEFRRDLHRHPEVSGSEERTARVVSGRLRALGLEVRSGVGGHGVVAFVRGANPGSLIAFRADMDAVRSQAPDPVEFRSVVPGVRHICGHDIHTTIGIALAEGLAAVREGLSGSVMLVFQPAEERATGARAMLDDGVFAEEKPAAIFGVHTAPLPVGQLGTSPGVLMPARDSVRVTLSGSGDLDGAAAAARELIEGVGTITPAQAVAPAPEGFIFVRTLPPSRDSGNRVTVRAVITLASAPAREAAREKIRKGIGELQFADVTTELRYQEKMVAGVTNDPDLTVRANASIREALGDAALIPITAIIPMFSEDFGSFQDHVPGVFYFLGVSNVEKGWVGMPHSPGYVADEGAILVGARAMASVILDALEDDPR